MAGVLVGNHVWGLLLSPKGFRLKSENPVPEHRAFKKKGESMSFVEAVATAVLAVVAVLSYIQGRKAKSK